MRIIFSFSYLRNLRRYLKKNPHQLINIKDKITLFKTSPNHPSLKLHKLKGKKREVWSIKIHEDLRILFVYFDEKIIFVDIGKHDEVY